MLLIGDFGLEVGLGCCFFWNPSICEKDSYGDPSIREAEAGLNSGGLRPASFLRSQRAKGSRADGGQGGGSRGGDRGEVGEPKGWNPAVWAKFEGGGRGGEWGVGGGAGEGGGNGFLKRNARSHRAKETCAF